MRAPHVLYCYYFPLFTLFQTNIQIKKQTAESAVYFIMYLNQKWIMVTLGWVKPEHSSLYSMWLKFSMNSIMCHVHQKLLSVNLLANGREKNPYHTRSCLIIVIFFQWKQQLSWFFLRIRVHHEKQPVMKIECDFLKKIQDWGNNWSIIGCAIKLEY